MHAANTFNLNRILSHSPKCQHSNLAVAPSCSLLLCVNVPYSVKFHRVQIYTIFADRPASAKIKTAKICTKMEIDDIITCVHRYTYVNEMLLYSLSAL